MNYSEPGYPVPKENSDCLREPTREEALDGFRKGLLSSLEIREKRIAGGLGPTQKLAILGKATEELGEVAQALLALVDEKNKSRSANLVRPIDLQFECIDVMLCMMDLFVQIGMEEHRGKPGEDDLPKMMEMLYYQMQQMISCTTAKWKAKYGL
jgi:hypothetical protein